MKTLSTYILEDLLVFENADGEIIAEKFWDKIVKIFGGDKDKLGKAMKEMPDDTKKTFTTSQYIAAKSKDKDIKKSAEEQQAEAEKGQKFLLKRVKIEVKRLMKGIKYISLPDHCLNQNELLKDLSDELNDDEGKELHKKFAEIIDKKWPDGEGTENYEKIKKKVEDSPVSDGPKAEDNTSDDNQQKEIKKEVNKETTETITDNKNLLSPLAKKAGVDGNTLRNFVGTQLRKTLGADQEKIKKNGTREAVQNALGEDVILGTCIMVLGALITNDQTKIEEICKQFGSSADELKNKLQKYK